MNGLTCTTALESVVQKTGMEAMATNVTGAVKLTVATALTDGRLENLRCD